MTEAEIAQRRIERLTEAEMYERRDTLRRELDERGLSRVQTTELHMLEEACETRHITLRNTLLDTAPFTVELLAETAGGWHGLELRANASREYFPKTTYALVTP